MSQAPLAFRGRNPDVLTCIANLSNDEVFTPPTLANAMLDQIQDAWASANHGASIWADPSVTFLDPFTKSGVFLREIVRRLNAGLAGVIPDLETRVDHILTRQVFGIAITELTGMLARRSVYCSKYANGSHSVAKSFTTEQGNIWFQRTEHTWGSDGRCSFCRASRDTYARGDELETHAYAFIHTNDIRARIAELFGADMQFDVIIGNPPYQLSDGGGTGSSAVPIYQHFINQAKKLDPRFLSMIIPSKWFSGGKGLDEFRETMLNDRRIRILVDYPDSRYAFSGVDVAGGVCYFLWDRDHPGTCRVDTVSADETITSERTLNEYKVFVRDNRVLNIARKIASVERPAFSTLVSARRPFGIDSSYEGNQNGELYLYASGNDGRIDRANVPKGQDLVDRWKVLLSKTSSEHAGQTDKVGRKRVFSRIEVMSPGSVATESYLIVGPFNSEQEAANAANYLRTRFVRFLVAAVLLTQNMTRSSFMFVPKQDFSSSWTDDELYAKYQLSQDEIDFIEKTIRPLELEE